MWHQENLVNSNQYDQENVGTSNNWPRENVGGSTSLGNEALNLLEHMGIKYIFPTTCTVDLLRIIFWKNVYSIAWCISQ